MAAGWFALVHAGQLQHAGTVAGGRWPVAAGMAGMAGMACSMRLGAPGRADGKGPAATMGSLTIFIFLYNVANNTLAG